MVRKWFNPAVHIRDFLIEHTAGYGYEIWKDYVVKVRGYVKPSNYNTFRRYIYILNRLKLIERVPSDELLNVELAPEMVGEKIRPPGAFERVYYRLVSTNDVVLKSYIWYHPQVLLYPLTSVGRAKYSKMTEAEKKAYSRRKQKEVYQEYAEIRPYIEKTPSKRKRGH